MQKGRKLTIKRLGSYIIEISFIDSNSKQSYYDVYKESNNRFLADPSIRRASAPVINDKTDSLLFEWIDVDLYCSIAVKMIV